MIFQLCKQFAFKFGNTNPEESSVRLALICNNHMRVQSSQQYINTHVFIFSDTKATVGRKKNTLQLIHTSSNVLLETDVFDCAHHVVVFFLYHRSVCSYTGKKNTTAKLVKTTAKGGREGKEGCLQIKCLVWFIS